jgi:hypothetical protein
MASASSAVAYSTLVIEAAQPPVVGSEVAMIYPYSMETDLHFFSYAGQDYVPELLFLRVGYQWVRRPNVFEGDPAPGIVVLGFGRLDVKPGTPSPILQRIFFGDFRDGIDNLNYEHGQALARPRSLIAGSPHFETPKPYEQAHNSSRIWHEKRFRNLEAMKNHSRFWDYDVGSRPARYDIPTVFGYGWGGAT